MHTPRLALLTALAAAVTAAAIAPSASAASQRYASPAGSGTDCTAASPCSIAEAVDDARTGDEVIVNPGDYPLTETLAEPVYNGVFQKVTIRGIAGRPRPRLLFSGQGQIGLRVGMGGSSLRYVEVVQTGQASAVFANNGASLDQVIARGSANLGAVTVNLRDSAIRDSIVVASGVNSTALATEGELGGAVTSTARNVTAIATGSGGIPILGNAVTGASVTLDLVNVLAYAGPDAIGIRVQTDGSGAQATITSSHTNYQGVDAPGGTARFVSGAGNQAEEPAFVNPAAGDYRQAPGSYTIDAGTDHGGLDIDGDPRKVGTTDIGADEFVPAPPPPAGPGGAITTTPTPPAQPFAGVALVSRRLAYTRRAIMVRLLCPAGTIGRCAGRAKLTARPRRAGARRVTLGRATFSIAPDRRARVKVRVTRAGLRRLRRVPRLRAKALTVARDGAGRRRTTRTAVTIRHRSAR